MHFAHDKKEIVSLARIGITREASRRDVPTCFQSEDVEAGKGRRAHKVGGGEQERVIEVIEGQESLRSAQGNYTQEDLLIGERLRVKEERSRGHSEDGRDENSRFECSLHQALARASVGCPLSGPGCAVRRSPRHLR